MKLNDIYSAAIQFMGYGYDSEVSAEYPLPKNPLSVCNRALVDLGLAAAKSLDDNIEAEETVIDALSYGIAMFICVFSGDSSRQIIYSQIYNAKRAQVLSKVEKVKDVMVYEEG